MNYLILEIMKNEDYETNPSRRVRSAWILARKRYEDMSEEEKKNIMNFLKR